MANKSNKVKSSAVKKLVKTELSSKNKRGKRSSGIIHKKETIDFEEAFINAPSGIAILNSQRKIIELNKAFYEMLGLPKEKLLNKKIDTFIYLFDLEDHKKLFKESLSGKNVSYIKDLRYINKDEKIIWVKEKVSKINSGTKQETLFVIAAEDITEQTKSRNKTASELYLLNNFIDNIPDNIYFKDLNSRFIKVNKATAAKLGSNHNGDLIGKSDFDIFDKENATGAFNDEQEIIRTGKSYIGTEKKEVWKDGKITWAISHKMPMYDENGNIIGTFGFTRDITERKKAEIVREALLNISEAAYTASDMESLYKRIHEAIITLMPANNIYIAIYDDKTQLISFPYYVDEFDPPPIPRTLKNGMTEYILRTGSAALIDQKKLKALSNSGEITVVGTTPKIWLGAPLKVGGKTIGVIVVQDYENEKSYNTDELDLLIFVTEQIAQVIERKRNADAIQKYLEELRQLNVTKDKFFSIIAHDLRSPFNSLLGLSEYLANPDEELSEAEKSEYINDIYHLIKNEYELLQNLLEWAAMQLGKVEFNPVNINLHDVVAKKVELLSIHAEKKNIALINMVENNICVLADKNMLGSIIQNFITNAIKFTNNSGTIKIYSEVQNGSAVISVEDNGIGMSKERVEEIFRLDSTKSSKGTAGEPGTGLGIILCKEMIEKQGGKLKVLSELNAGTKVIFDVPVAKN